MAALIVDPLEAVDVDDGEAAPLPVAPGKGDRLASALDEVPAIAQTGQVVDGRQPAQLLLGQEAPIDLDQEPGAGAAEMLDQLQGDGEARCGDQEGDGGGACEMPQRHGRPTADQDIECGCDRERDENDRNGAEQGRAIPAGPFDQGVEGAHRAAERFAGGNSMVARPMVARSTVDWSQVIWRSGEHRCNVPVGPFGPSPQSGPSIVARRDCCATDRHELAHNFNVNKSPDSSQRRESRGVSLPRRGRAGQAALRR